MSRRTAAGEEGSPAPEGAGSNGTSARRIGLPHVHHRRIGSTNERARELAVAGAPHGTVVTADEQTAGRGRQGRAWLAPPGRSLVLSLLLRDLGPDRAALPLAAAVAVCEACEAIAPVACAIKWPNDVWIERRKVAGILVEGRPAEGWAVVGIGLNVLTSKEELPKDLRSSATSVAMAAGGAPGDLTVERAFDAVLEALGRRLSDEPGEVIAAWRRRDALLGERVRWQGGEGVADGIDGEGALRVRLEGGEVVLLDAGEVHLSPPEPGAA